MTIGKQALRDWFDQIISGVVPSLKYDVRLFDDCERRGNLSAGHVIAAVSIFPSESAPHQASDRKYYIRAGAHTVSANHFLVEALWARRSMQKPVLVHAIRTKPGANSIVQVGVVAITDAPAVDVEFTITPLKGILAQCSSYFPIKLPVVDRNNSFFLDVALIDIAGTVLSDDVRISIRYSDYAGNRYTHENSVPLQSAICPLAIGTEAETKMARSLEKIEKSLQEIAKAHQQ